MEEVTKRNYTRKPVPMGEMPATSEIEMRPAMRDDNPLERARRRAAELRQHGAVNEDFIDEFYVNPNDIPDGWSYEWKRKSVLGQEDPGYNVAIARAGWEPVPAARHPSYMPAGMSSGVIERKGMVLMERPKEITDDARNRDLRAARNQVKQKEDQLNETAPGQFGKDDPRVKAKIGKSYEAIPISE
jgi:hypothetical protein